MTKEASPREFEDGVFNLRTSANAIFNILERRT